MQAPPNPLIKKWQEVFEEYCSQVTKAARHHWTDIECELITEYQVCFLRQCKHCNKYLSLFAKGMDHAQIYLNNANIAHVSKDIRPYGKLSLCERLNIMR